MLNEAVTAHVVRYVEHEDLLNVRCTSSTLRMAVLLQLDGIREAMDARTKTYETLLRGYVCNVRLFKSTSTEMRKAVRELGEADFKEVLSATPPSVAVKTVIIVLELLLGPNAGPEVLRHWAFLRKSLSSKWPIVLKFLLQDSLDVVTNFVANPARLTRVKEARGILEQAGLAGATQDFMAGLSRFCGVIWPAIVGIIDLAYAFDENDAHARAIAIGLVRLRVIRRQLTISAVVLKHMSDEARRHLANGRLFSAIPLLNTDLELFVVSKAVTNVRAKRAIMRRRLELREQRKSGSQQGSVTNIPVNVHRESTTHFTYPQSHSLPT